MVELLIAKGVDLNPQIPIGYTPLIIATRSGYEDIAIMLIEAGADLSLEDRTHKTCL